MDKTFLKVKIDTNKGYMDACICLDEVYMFRKCNNDCNVTIVDAGEKSYIVYMKFDEFAKIMLEHFNIK